MNPDQSLSAHTLECKNKRNKTFLTIYCYPEKSYLHAQWQGYASEQDLKDGCMEILNAANAFQLTKCLDDDRKLIGPQNMLLEWAKEEFVPHAVKSSLRSIAHLHSENIFANMSYEELEPLLRKSFEFRNFATEKEAFEWFEQLDN